MTQHEATQHEGTQHAGSASKDAASKDAASKDAASKDAASKDAASKDAASKDDGGADTDGRTRRRSRNVDNALDAMIDLATEGNLDPTWEEIADRAGVSHRSLYRYFDNRPALLKAAVERVMTRIAPLLAIADLGKGPLEDRIVAFVKSRTDTYWGFGPIARTAFSPAWGVTDQDGIEGVRSVLCGQLVAQFAPELDMLNHSERVRTIALIDTAFQFESLEYLAAHCRLEQSEVIRALEAHLRMHLEPLLERRP